MRLLAFPVFCTVPLFLRIEADGFYNVLHCFPLRGRVLCAAAFYREAELMLRTKSLVLSTVKATSKPA